MVGVCKILGERGYNTPACTRMYSFRLSINDVM